MEILGYIITLIFTFNLLTFYKGQQVSSYLLIVIFLMTMILKKNREKFFKLIDKKLLMGILCFIISPFIISVLTQGILSRVYINHFLYWLIFFPLVFYIDEDKKLYIFFKILFIGSVISIAGGIYDFLKNYGIWKQDLYRVSFAIHIIDYANILTMVLLFLISFIFFYKNENKIKNIIIKVILSIIALLNIFVLVVNKTKMVYVALIPCIIYILYRKKDYLVIFFINICAIGYYFLPKSIYTRLNNLLTLDTDPSSRLRMIFWEGSLNTIKNNMWFGTSYRERSQKNLEYINKIGAFEFVKYWYGVDPVALINTHNTYLHHLVNYGILGFLSVIYLFFIVIPYRLLKINFKKYKEMSYFLALEIGLKASILAFFIQSLFEFNFHKKPMIYAFSILIFLINYLYKKMEKLEDKKVEKTVEIETNNKKSLSMIITILILFVVMSFNFIKENKKIKENENVVVEIEMKIEKDMELQIFYMKDIIEMGFKHSVKNMIKKTSENFQKIEVELEGVKKYKILRVDFGKYPGVVEVKSIKVKGNKNINYYPKDLYENSKFGKDIENTELVGDRLIIKSNKIDPLVILPTISEENLKEIRKNTVLFTLSFSLLYFLVLNTINFVFKNKK